MGRRFGYSRVPILPATTAPKPLTRVRESAPVNSPADNAMSALAREVARKLLDAKARLVTAESCTGGWIAKLCTDIAGSSDWYDCGYVVYSNAAKQRDLGVPQDVLEKHGAVSEQTVKALALNAIARTNANVSLAVSGIAGPTGGVPGKPVGTVWFAVGFKR